MSDIYSILVKQVHKENYYNKSKAYKNMLCIGRLTNPLILILGITVTTVIIIHKVDKKFKILKPKIDEWNTILTKTTISNTNLIEVHPSVQTTRIKQSLTWQLKGSYV